MWFRRSTQIGPRSHEPVLQPGSQRRMGRILYPGKRIRHVINIRTSGSDLGPAMAYEALKFHANGP